MSDEELVLRVRAETGEVAANLQKIETAVDGVTKATDRLDTSAKKAAKSLNEVKDGGGGLNKSLGEAGSRLNKAVEGYSRLREAVAKLAMVYSTAAIGVKLFFDSWIKQVNANSEILAAQQKAEAGTIKFEAAMRLAQRGLIDLGGTQEQFLARYDAYVARMHEGKKAVDEEAEALKRRKAAFDELAAGLSDLQKKTSFTILSPEDAAKQLDSVKALAEGLNNAFEKAYQAGGEGERDKWVTANEEAVKKVTEAYQKAGLELPTHFQAIAKAQDDSAAKAMEWAAQQAAAYDQVAAAADRRRAAESAATNFSAPVAAEFKHIQDAAVGAAAASGQFGTNLDNVAEVVVRTGGTMSVGPPYFIQYAQATREATQALLDFAVASKAVREEQAAAMEVTKGWTDYILTLKEGYESGITSLYNYVTALGSFKTQLQQMFSAASGEAKDALEGMIQLIDKLIQTAGAGKNGQFGTPDFSPLRQLEREFERKKRGN